MAKIGETQNIHNRNIQAESWCICAKTLWRQYEDKGRIFWGYSILISLIGKRHHMWPLFRRSRSLCFLEWKVILSKFEPLFALALFRLCSQFFMDIPSPEEPPWGRSAVVKGENKTEKGLVFALQYSYGQISFFGCNKLSLIPLPSKYVLDTNF